MWHVRWLGRGGVLGLLPPGSGHRGWLWKAPLVPAAFIVPVILL